jgi:hypothetical protein
MLMSVTLRWDKKPFSVYSTCKGITSLHYTNLDLQALSPFVISTNPVVERTFEPLNCPNFKIAGSPVFVSDEFFCDAGKKISYNTIEACGTLQFLLFFFLVWQPTS